MKELVIISGKGGTGKTSITAALACLATNPILCDADVDAANLHLLLQPEIRKRFDFYGGGLAAIDPETCVACGTCTRLCRFHAISSDFQVNPVACEGCGVCADFCPESAIDFQIKKCGQWFISDTRLGGMVHAQLGIAEENSGKLVTRIRQETKQIAKSRQADLIITDGPPGAGCPVIAAIGGATAVLVVTEPSVSGIHDMKRVVDLARHFQISAMVCINKFDLNMEQTEQIEQWCQMTGIPVVGRIPFHPAFTQSVIMGKTILEYDSPLDIVNTITDMWERIWQSFMIN